MAIALLESRSVKIRLGTPYLGTLPPGPRPAGGREPSADADNPVRSVSGRAGDADGHRERGPREHDGPVDSGRAAACSREDVSARPEHSGRRGAPGPHGRGVQGTMRIPAKTNGRPPETGTPNVLICLAERTEQLPMTARQIGGNACVFPCRG
jgi:hypothetical protein